jgi:hypothetical protein
MQIKELHSVPQSLTSCHTAIVDSYVVEGHVPASEIYRLLAERPDIIGIAVPGMPSGSPGMEIEGFDAEPFEVVTFDHTGEIDLYASYP